MHKGNIEKFNAASLACKPALLIYKKIASPPQHKEIPKTGLLKVAF
jgi:hypothetical protein